MSKDYFVRISQPNTNRVLLLESSSLLVKSLQSYHKVLFLREKKQKNIDILKSQSKEIILLLKKLEQHLPKEHLPDSLDEVKKPSSKKHQEKSPEHHTQNKIEKLDKTLETIKRRLEEMK